MRAPFVSIAAAAIATSPCNGLLNNMPFIVQADPSLNKYAEAKESSVLKISLNIGQVEGGSRLGISGLTVELHGRKSTNNHQ